MNTSMSAEAGILNTIMNISRLSVQHLQILSHMFSSLSKGSFKAMPSPWKRLNRKQPIHPKGKISSTCTLLPPKNLRPAQPAPLEALQPSVGCPGPTHDATGDHQQSHSLAESDRSHQILANQTVKGWPCCGPGWRFNAWSSEPPCPPLPFSRLLSKTTTGVKTNHQVVRLQ